MNSMALADGVLQHGKELSSMKVKPMQSWRVKFANGLFGAVVITLAVLTGVETAEAEEPEATLATVRPDVSEVLQALAYRAMGMEVDVIGSVGFSEEIGSLADPTGLAYDYLYLQKIALTRFDEPGADQAEIVGLMHFADAMGRSAYLGIGAHYTARNGVIFVQTAATEPVYLPHGDTEVLISRSRDLSGFDQIKGKDLEAVYLEMLQNGVDLDDVPLSRTEPERLTLLIVDKVRQRESTVLDILYRQGARPDVKALSRHNQDGWAYILLEADFPPNEGSEFELFRLSGIADGPEPISLGHLFLGGGG